MKNRKLFIGIVAVAAVVCLNLRHAWRNYGIAENRIMAGAMAGSPNPEKEDSTTCPDKEGFPEVHHNEKLDSIKHEIRCPVSQVVHYYKEYSDGYRRLITTEYIDFKENSSYFKPKYTDLTGLKRDPEPATTDLFTSQQYICTTFEQGNCCYPTTILTDCDKLVRGTN